MAVEEAAWRRRRKWRDRGIGIFFHFVIQKEGTVNY
jgi:hypothetical protein